MFSINKLRAEVAEAIVEGRATYLPAGARDNATARILVDGVEVMQASMFTEPLFYRSRGTFGETALMTREQYRGM